MRFKLILLLYLLGFPGRTEPSLKQFAKDHGTVGNIQKGAKTASDFVNDPVGTSVNVGKNFVKENVPGGDAIATTFDEIRDGKFPAKGAQKAVDLIPTGTLPPGVKTGAKLGVGLVGGLINGENFFKVAGETVMEIANPVKLVDNVLNEVLGPAAKFAKKAINFFFCFLFCAGEPPPFDPVKAGKDMINKVAGKGTAALLEELANFSGTLEEKQQVIDAINKDFEIENAKRMLENSLPAVEEVTEKLTPILDLDPDELLDQLDPLDRIGDMLGGDLGKNLAKKLGIDLPASLDKLRKDVLNAGNLLKAGKSLGLDLPFGLDGFLADPYRPDGPYGPNGLYGVNGVFGPDGKYGPNSKTGPFGPNGLFGVNGPKGLNGPFGPNGAFNPMGLMKKGFQQAAPKLAFLHNPLTSKLLENTPFGSKGTHGLNGLFGPNGPYGPFGDFGPNGPFGPKGPFGPFGGNDKVTEWIEKFQNNLGKINCQDKIQEVIRKFKNKLSDLLKNDMPEKLKKLFGDKFDKLKKALDKAKDLFKKLDELKDKLPKLPEPNPVKQIKNLLEKIKKVHKNAKKPMKKKLKNFNITSTTTPSPRMGMAPKVNEALKDGGEEILTCLETPPHPGMAVFDQVKSLPGQFKKARDPFSSMADALNLIQGGDGIEESLTGFNSVVDRISNAPNGDYAFLKNDKQFLDTRKFMKGIEMPMKKLEQPPDIMETLGILGGANPAIDSVSTYLNGIKLGGDGCRREDLESPKEMVEDVLDLIDAVDEVRDGKAFEKAEKLFEDVKAFVLDFKELDKLHKLFLDDVKESDEDKMIFRNLKHMEPLLEKSIDTIEDLKGLNEMYEIRKEVQTVIKSEKTIQEVIRYVRDPTERIILDIVWKDFRKSAKNLTRIQNKIEKLEKILLEFNSTSIQNQKTLIEMNESSEVKEFLFVYVKAAELNFTETIDLKTYKESLKLLDNQTRSRKDVLEIYESFEKVYETTSSINWHRIQIEFEEMPDVIVRTKGEFMAMKLEEKVEDQWWLIYLLIGIICSIACSSCLIILFFIWWRRRHQEEKPYICPEDLWNYSYVQMQDARLKMNRMDSKGRTDLYKAVLAKKWYKVKDLIDQGALIDATCGPYLRTALFELVLMKDTEHAKDFLDNGAYILQPDVAGNYPEQYSDENGFHLLFDQYSKEDQRRRVIPPNTPRPYNILVVNGDYLAKKERKQLPKRIRNKITWGYKPKMDLNKFTHIVVPPKYSQKDNTLTVTDDDLFIWKCVASLSNVMPETWIEAILRSDNYIEDDHVHMLVNMDYNENEYEDALLKLKTDLHMGRPRFLTNTKITVLETKDKKKAEKKKEWEDILHSFGAEIHSKPVLDSEKTHLPYNSLYPYKENNKKVQNSCWILKYEDSQIKPSWKKETQKCTVAPFRFVLECIARYQILPIGSQLTPSKEEISPESGTSKTGKTTTSGETTSQISTSKEPVTP